MKQKIWPFLGIFITNLIFAAPTINIGAIYNVTGSQAALDQPSLRGAKLAIDEINAKGGVLGQKIQLKIERGDSKIVNIHSLARKIASDTSISIVIGLSDNDMVEAAAPPILKAGKVLISSGATSPQLLIQFPKHLFLAAVTDNVQAAAAAQFAIKGMHRQRAAVLYQRDMAYTQTLAHYFVQAFQHFSGKILYQQPIDMAHLPITKLIAWQKLPVTLLFLAAGPEMAPKLIQQLRKAGIKLPIFGGDSYVANDIIAEDQQTATDIYFTTHGYFDKAFMGPRMQRFVTAYTKKYGQPSQSIFTALGYDAVQLAVEGIRKAKSTQPNKIAAAIKSLHDFPAVTGKLNLTSGLPNKTVTLVKIINGKARIAALVIPQYWPKPMLPLKQPPVKSTIDLQHRSGHITG